MITRIRRFYQRVPWQQALLTLLFVVWMIWFIAKSPLKVRIFFTTLMLAGGVIGALASFVLRRRRVLQRRVFTGISYLSVIYFLLMQMNAIPFNILGFMAAFLGYAAYLTMSFLWATASPESIMASVLIEGASVDGPPPDPPMDEQIDEEPADGDGGDPEEWERYGSR